MKSKLFGLNAKMALAALAVCGAFTSCYEKEEVDTTPAPTLPDPTYVITGSVYVKNADGSQSPKDGATVVIAKGGQQAATATTDANGFYVVDRNLSAGAYTVTVDLDGFFKATRNVYLQNANAGQTSMGTADFVLISVESSEVVPPVEEPTIPGEDVIEDQVNVVNTEAAAALDALEIEDADVKFDEAQVEDGNVTTLATVTLTKEATTGEATTVKIPVLEGFVSDVTDETVVRAISDAALWNKYVAAALGMSSEKPGFVASTIDYTIAGVAGTQLESFRVKLVMTTENYKFMVNNKEIAGNVTYQGGIFIQPKYDSHDSHDWHGVNPGAGGGATGNY